MTTKREYTPEQKKRKSVYNKKYRKDNLEKINAQNKEWKLNNPEKVKAINKRWKLKNPEKMERYREKWRLNNPESRKASREKQRLEKTQEEKKEATRLSNQKAQRKYRSNEENRKKANIRSRQFYHKHKAHGEKNVEKEKYLNINTVIWGGVVSTVRQGETENFKIIKNLLHHVIIRNKGYKIQDDIFKVMHDTLKTAQLVYKNQRIDLGDTVTRGEDGKITIFKEQYYA